MSAFPKADVQNVGIGNALDVRLWPKADVQRTAGAGSMVRCSDRRLSANSYSDDKLPTTGASNHWH